jgi:hypothetical protein
MVVPTTSPVRKTPSASLEIETRLFGPQSIPVGETLAELALQASNQGRF